MSCQLVGAGDAGGNAQRPGDAARRRREVEAVMCGLRLVEAKRGCSVRAQVGQEALRARVLRVAEEGLGARPISRMRPASMNQHAVGDLAREAHLVGDAHHRHAVVARGCASRPAPRRPSRGRARWSARRTASPAAPSPAPARSRRAAAGRPTAAPGSDSALAARPDALEQLHRLVACLGALDAAHRIGDSITLSSADRCGNRLKLWNTKPMRLRSWFSSLLLIGAWTSCAVEQSARRT